jgi:hypothetical protein
LSRHSARPLLLRLAGARTEREDRGESRSEAYRRLVPAAEGAAPGATTPATPPSPSKAPTPAPAPTPAESDLAALVARGDLVAWLKAKNYRLPDETGVLVAAAAARPDLVFRLDGVSLAVFVDTPDRPADSTRDQDAADRLEEAGWDVVRFPADADWDAVVAHNADYFHLR